MEDHLFLLQGGTWLTCHCYNRGKTFDERQKVDGHTEHKIYCTERKVWTQILDRVNLSENIHMVYIIPGAPTASKARMSENPLKLDI